MKLLVHPLALRPLPFVVAALLYTFLLGCNAGNQHSATANDSAAPPNVIIIFTDDQGYGDLSCYGHPTLRTPNLDRLATEGQLWTQFYAAAPVCTPSRAGLLTGRLPIRSGMTSKQQVVLFPNSPGGLPAEEVTIAEVLKQRGYATMAIGKWHLGHLPQYLPTAQGFDHYFGVPYSNDMDQRAGAMQDYRSHLAEARYLPPVAGFQVPLLRDTTEIERPADQQTLTQRYVSAADDFIREYRDQPFFLYLAHHQPHIPLFVSDDNYGRSRRGIYGDVIEEIDAGVGRLIATLEELGIDDNTLVVFTSDNGPWLSFRQHGGTAGLLRAGKGTTFEGGQRVPGIFWGPRLVAPGRVLAPGSSLDLLPTIARLAGAPLPTDVPLDGYDLGPVLQNPEAAGPRAAFYYWSRAELAAVRRGRWKLHVRQSRPVYYGKTDILEAPELYDLQVDPAEKYDLADVHPDTVAVLLELLESHRREVGPGGADQLAERE